MRGWWLGTVLLAAGCVSQQDHDALRAERDRLAMRVDALEAEVETLETQNARLRAEVEKRSAESARRSKELARTREALGLAEGQELRAVIQTELGDIACELWPEVAPVTVRNFVQLAEGTRTWTHPETGAERTDPLYDGTVFHRVIEGFMIQGGDPLGTGRGGPGYRFEDEVRDDVVFDEPGLLAMANSGPDTNGSQFQEARRPRHPVAAGRPGDHRAHRDRARLIARSGAGGRP